VHKTNPFAAIGFFALLIFFACTENGDPTIGPCEHKYLDPVLEITNVSDEQSGQAITAFKITAVEIEDRSNDLHQLINNVSFNIVWYDSVLYCNPPCGFGFEDGDYRLKISAIGYRDTTAAIDAQYQNIKGGCPSSSSGSTVVSIKMQKT
jgi:hypothetical protein